MHLIFLVEELMFNHLDLKETLNTQALTVPISTPPELSSVLSSSFTSLPGIVPLYICIYIYFLVIFHSCLHYFHAKYCDCFFIIILNLLFLFCL